MTRSASYFVVRCLDRSLMRPRPVVPSLRSPSRAPEGSLVIARPPAAVAAGNVETSSRIADVVFLALGEAIDVPAQGQGTMNNVTLGKRRLHVLRDDRRRSGRLPDADGPSAVHVAMSNTLRPRPRRSSSPTRSASSETLCGSAPAGRAGIVAATASSASCASRALPPLDRQASGGAMHRRAERAARRVRPAATC